MQIQLIAIVLLAVGYTIADQEKTCPENEEFKTCGTACPPTCQNKSPQICTDNCVIGCFCKKGYIREGPGGRCVPESCENVHVCEKNEIFSTCATACPRTCGESEPKICPLYCRTGCICKDYYIRETKDGKCIPEVACKKECGENEIYNECGSLCPGTCSQPVKVCEKKCVKGCFCKEGYVLDDKTRKCVRKEDCPKRS
ncbi:serine protease inhibitor swm-1-like [Tribolium madens]|uniref:serine protease inhibitor swm-1-like n=1 Tax=Tribolium madens TaxID=41895 RepID=UPI001CF72C24|nr:serine protease inhibitor swm-1-like [Tribolium madens]